MPPRAKRAPKPGTGLTEAEREAEAEAVRLRTRAQGQLVQRDGAIEASAGTLPRALRRCDGADICKKNSSRKRRYLFMFPGAVELPPGGEVGRLTGLDSRTPTLYVEYPPHGRVKMKGSLVFPKNSLITVKGSVSRSRTVQVVDNFETLVVFSEWAWVGREDDNPGEVPKPIPAALGGTTDAVQSIWRSSGDSSAPTPRSRTPAASSRQTPDSDSASLDFGEAVRLNKRRTPTELSDADVEFEVPDQALPSARASTRRKRATVNYAAALGDSDDDDDEDDDMEDEEDADGRNIGTLSGGPGDEKQPGQARRQSSLNKSAKGSGALALASSGAAGRRDVGTDRISMLGTPPLDLSKDKDLDIVLLSDDEDEDKVMSAHVKNDGSGSGQGGDVDVTLSDKRAASRTKRPQRSRASDFGPMFADNDEESDDD